MSTPEIPREKRIEQAVKVISEIFPKLSNIGGTQSLRLKPALEWFEDAAIGREDCDIVDRFEETIRAAQIDAITFAANLILAQISNIPKPDSPPAK